MAREYTAFFPFCGLGAGALGFLQARATLFGAEARFRSIGGIDVDPLACADFEALTGSAALCADVATLGVDQLRDFAGAAAPDVVFSSPPCKGFSGLLSEARSRGAKYQALNRLVVAWTELMLATWGSAPPRLVLIENVPRIETRGRKLLAEVKRCLRAAGYVFHGSAHDCGEIGGLAQHRRRFLLVARHVTSTPALLYQAPRRRVRGCGEVLGTLPLPGDESAGPLHKLPRISALNWARLALIPPGGDWRDLPSDTREPRAREDRTHRNKYVVVPWERATGAVIGATRPGSGAPSVADIRMAKGYPHTYGVLAWGAPAHTVTGTTASPGQGPFSVADPRIGAGGWGYANQLVCLGWQDPARTITGSLRVGAGALSVADNRLGAYRGSYGVSAWSVAAGTVTGSAATSTGSFSVADPRLGSLQIDNGTAAVADPRVPGNPSLAVRWYLHDVRDASPVVPVLPTADGSWHRPLTTLELAALQGLPTRVGDKPLTLAGTSATAWRERVGNAVPVPAAEAIARQILLTLMGADAERWTLSGEGTVWVEAPREFVQ